MTAVPDRHGALLLSLHPRYAEAILSGAKTVELRRRAPKVMPPVAVIYGSGTARSVLGVALLKGSYTGAPTEVWRRFGGRAGLSRGEFDAYFLGADQASGLELDHPRRATTPLSLEGLRDLGLEPPQSWRYVDDDSLEQLLHALGTKPLRREARCAARVHAPVPRLGLLQNFADMAMACRTLGRRPLGSGMLHDVTLTTVSPG